MDTNFGNRCIPRVGTNIPALEYPAIYEQLQQGETQARVAADYGATQ
jgi:hypothetical protein